MRYVPFISNALQPDIDIASLAHQAYLRVKVDIALKVPGGEIQLIRDELVSIERSYKYTLDEAEALFAAVGLRIVARWNDTDRTGDYNLFMVEKPPFGFPSTLETVEKGGNPFGLPTIAEWDSLWKAWDCVVSKRCNLHR